MKRIFDKYGEIIRYLIIGALTTLVSLIIYYGLTIAFLDAKKALELQIANIISWVCAVTFAYFTNKYYVFKDASMNKNGIVKFFLSRILTLLLDMLLMYILVTKLSFNDRIIKVIVQVIVIIGNYTLSKLFVFKKRNNVEKTINP